MPEENPLTEADLKLLQELGLLGCASLDTCNETINSLRLRQLDKLKLILSRISNEKSLFSPEVTEGIRKNDLKMFARAIIALNVYVGKP